VTPAMELGLKNVIVGPLFRGAATGDELPSAVGKEVGMLAGSRGIPAPGIRIAGDGASTEGAPAVGGLSSIVGGAAAGVVAPALANTSTYPRPFLLPGAPDMLYPPGPAGVGPGRLLPPAKAESIGGGAAGARSSSSPSVLTHLPSFSSNTIVLSVSSGR